MRFRAIGFVASTAIMIGAAFPLHARDWPMYRADAARTGYTSDTLPDDLQLRWVYRCRVAPAPAWPTSLRVTFDFASQPVILGNLVLLGSSAEDKIVAIDADSGQLRWEFFTGGPVRFAPAAWNDRVFVASDDGYLYALKSDTGTQIWRHRGGPDERKCLANRRMISRWPARGGPVVMGETVYYAAGIWPSDGVFLHALNVRTGKTV